MSEYEFSLPRKYWLRALQRVSVDELKVLVTDVLEHYQVAYKAVPQSGLGILQAKDSAMHESYYLGEFPMATSWVVLTDKDGSCYEGAAQIMDDDENLASLLALCDAVLANQLIKFDELTLLLAAGEADFQKETQTRKAMLGSTAVDFSLLETTE